MQNEIPSDFAAEPFLVGREYTRNDVYRLLNVPIERQRGNWETGYHEWNGDFYIFCNVGTAGRGGFDYANAWLDAQTFQWFSKERTHVGQPQINRLLHPTGKILLFTREDNRGPFTFHGYLEPISHLDSTPVQVTWRLGRGPRTESLGNEGLGPSAADDVRAIRTQLDAECGHDLHRLIERARQAGEEFRH
jgi:5-methylcytosine-specific restriction protein A